MYLNIVGQPIVVVNSSKVAKDLLDKRSGIYSDRPVSVSYNIREILLSNEIFRLDYVWTTVRTAISLQHPCSLTASRVGFGASYAMQNYGEKFRKQRRMVSKGFSVAKVPQYYGLQEKEATVLINNLLKNPKALFPEVHL